MRRAPGPWLAIAACVLLAACTRSPAPEDVSLAYGRAIYADDADAAWQLISEADRQVKDEPTFRRQQRDLHGFAGDAVRQLADYITATPVKTTITGDRAVVTLRFRLPDANADAVRSLMLGWDESDLNRLSAEESRRIIARLRDLHTRGELPTVEGEETMQLLREDGRWRVFLNWAGGVRVTFAAIVDPALPVAVAVSPASVVLAPGERVRVSLRATNTGGREVRTRVAHRIEPNGEASHLALLQCPLLVPARLAPGASDEYESEYMLLGDAPASLRALTVTYRFPAAKGMP